MAPNESLPSGMFWTTVNDNREKQGSVLIFRYRYKVQLPTRVARGPT